ncbi:cornifelin homolog [Glandiceps talaboti]
MDVEYFNPQPSPQPSPQLGPQREPTPPGPPAPVKAAVVMNNAPDEFRDWQYGLFGCFGDCSLCLFTYFFPCIVAGQNAAAVGKSCLCYGFYSLVPIARWFCHGGVRSDIRSRYRIEGSTMNDYLTHCFCQLCVIIQEARELKANAVIPMKQSMARN